MNVIENFWVFRVHSANHLIPFLIFRPSNIFSVLKV